MMARREDVRVDGVLRNIMQQTPEHAMIPGLAERAMVRATATPPSATPAATAPIGRFLVAEQFLNFLVAAVVAAVALVAVDQLVVRDAFGQRGVLESVAAAEQNASVLTTNEAAEQVTTSAIAVILVLVVLTVAHATLQCDPDLRSTHWARGS